MAKIFIDEKEYEVDSSKNLLEAVLSLKLDLPYFCWHPALGSVGACRQCAVIKYKDETDKVGRIVMACMEPAVEGTRISLKAPEAKQFRENVIEWLMINHPHDCPVCDEGGECHLQDMTLMSGHNYRRYRFDKRTYKNQYLGPFVHHEMNRCIQCYRCVRYYKDYAGGKDFDVFGCHDNVYFGRAEDGVLESEFSGNLVEVCPTGVFTDHTSWQHYTRKWDLTSAPSVCTNCSLGCNTIPGERYGILRRIMSRYNSKVNGYFLCDRGRFGYGYVNNDKRIRRISLRGSVTGALESVNKETFLNHIKNISQPGKVIGIGSPRASLESNFALRELVGKENFYSGVLEKEFSLVKTSLNILKNGPSRTPSLKETEEADAVLVLGEDLTNTAPMLALFIRQTIHTKAVEIAQKAKIPEWHDAAVRDIAQHEKSPVIIITPDTTKLDEIAEITNRALPADIARIGFAIANNISAKSPASEDLSDDVKNLVKNISDILLAAKRPLIVSGTSNNSEAIIQAAANIAWGLKANGKEVNLFYTVPEVNSMGLAMLDPKSLDSAFEAADNQKADTVIILENDLYRRADKQTIDKFLNKFKNIIVLDHYVNDTTLKSSVLLPSGTFAEADGTFVNNEGRAQRFYQIFVDKPFHPESEVTEAWRWIRDIAAAQKVERISNWNNLFDVINSLIKSVPIFAGIDKITPPPSFRIAGQKIARESHRYTGRTAIFANISVHEQKPPEDPDSPLSFTMEGTRTRVPSSIVPMFWSPGWNSQQAINKFQIEIGGPLHDGDPGLRLIEPKSTSNINFFNNIPKASLPNEDEFYFIPKYHIFGSEELSLLSPPVAELAPKPYLLISIEDIEKLKVSKDSIVTVIINGITLNLPVKISTGLPKGVAGLPVGLPDFPKLDLPNPGKITEVRNE